MLAVSALVFTSMPLVAKADNTMPTLSSVSPVLIKNKLYDGGIRLSEEIFDLLLVRLRS